MNFPNSWTFSNSQTYISWFVWNLEIRIFSKFCELLLKFLKFFQIENFFQIVILFSNSWFFSFSQTFKVCTNLFQIFNFSQIDELFSFLQSFFILYEPFLISWFFQFFCEFFVQIIYTGYIIHVNVVLKELLTSNVFELYKTKLSWSRWLFGLDGYIGGHAG